MRYLLVFSLLLLTALPAHAIKIVNLDKVGRVLIVNNGGEVREIKLAPNASYLTYGPMVDIGLKAKGKMHRADPFSDYAIWPGGKLILQNRRDTRTGK